MLPQYKKNNTGQLLYLDNNHTNNLHTNTRLGTIYKHDTWTNIYSMHDG